MITVQQFRDMLTMRRVMCLQGLATDAILVFGFCHECGKYVVNTVLLYSDEDAREAFSWFFESMEIDCKLAQGKYERMRG